MQTELKTAALSAAPALVEAPKPQTIVELIDFSRHVALPPSWSIQHIDEEQHLPNPRHKTGQPRMDDHASFMAYLKRHATDSTAVYCDANLDKFVLSFTGILDDHTPTEPRWRKHVAHFTPLTSVEWERWKEKNGKPFSQAAFAEFLEENIADIVGNDEGEFPSGARMLKMAVDLEISCEKRVKTKVNLQAGGVRLTMVEDDDEKTRQELEVFGRFQLGLRVFRGQDSGFPLQARLRHRIEQGKVMFTYHLIRQDLVFEAAAKKLIETIGSETGFPLFMGIPRI